MFGGNVPLVFFLGNVSVQASSILLLIMLLFLREICCGCAFTSLSHHMPSHARFTPTGPQLDVLFKYHLYDHPSSPVLKYGAAVISLSPAKCHRTVAKTTALRLPRLKNKRRNEKRHF